MAVLFKENFIDRWVKTCTIQFWSIGSYEDIKFDFIKKTKDLYEKLLGKSGIKERDPEKLFELKPRFSIIDMFRSTFYLTILTLLALGAGIFLMTYYDQYSMVMAGIYDGNDLNRGLVCHWLDAVEFGGSVENWDAESAQVSGPAPVSYTHLTLPTN